MVAVPRGPVALALVLWALSAVRCASASVNELKRVPIAAAVPLADQWLLSEPVFAYDDRPGGAEQPFVHLDAVFSREVVGTAGYIEVLLYHSDDQKYIGMESNEDGATKTILCGPVGGTAPADQTEVKRSPEYEVKRSPEYDASESAFYDKVWVPPNATSVKFNPYKWYIKRSGVYTIMVAVCSFTLEVDTMDATAFFVNPYGYLPAHLYGYIPFWSWMLVAYGAVGTVWLMLSIRSWRDLLHLQQCISGILFVGMVEACAWNVLFESYNEQGGISLTASIAVSVLNTGKRTLSRMLVLVVSMGYGVVKPTLGVRGQRVVLLGAVYFVFSTLLAVVDWIGNSSELGMTTRLIFVLPVAALDSGFSVWIFVELSATVAQLQARNQRTKLTLYRRFTRIMAFLILVSVSWSTYEVHTTEDYADVKPSFYKNWETFWSLEAAWPFLYFVVLLAIMWLWAPSKNAVRYAYSEEISLDDEYDDDDDDDEEASGGMEMDVRMDAGRDGANAVIADKRERNNGPAKQSVEAAALQLIAGTGQEEDSGSTQVKMT